MKIFVKKILLVMSVMSISSSFSSSEIDKKEFFEANNSLTSLISKEEILSRIQELALTLKQDYKDREITFVMVLKGALCFTADLIRELSDHPFCLEAIKASSYGENGTSRGELTISSLDQLKLKGKDVIIIDDICDSGQTLASIKKQLSTLNPSSLKTLVLLNKQAGKIQGYSAPDYSLFDIENKFIVGYGLDYKEYFRGLPGIYILNETIFSAR